MINAKLELRELSNEQAVTLARTLVTKFGENATTFPTPRPAPAELTAAADALDTLEQERAIHAKTLENLVIQVRAQRDTLNEKLTTAGGYVSEIANGDAAIITLAGLTPSADGPSPVGVLPKVEDLRATQGDESGEVDLTWDPIRRGLKSYLVEISTSVDGQSDWTFGKVETKSKTTLTGLESGKRYWFCVKAIGAAGEGPASEIATKIAP